MQIINLLYFDLLKCLVETCLLFLPAAIHFSIGHRATPELLLLSLASLVLVVSKLQSHLVFRDIREYGSEVRHFVIAHFCAGEVTCDWLVLRLLAGRHADLLLACTFPFLGELLLALRRGLSSKLSLSVQRIQLRTALETIIDPFGKGNAFELLVIFVEILDIFVAAWSNS